MKKLIYGAACAALVLAASACSKKASDTSAEVRQLSDSVSIYFGRATGGYVLNDFTRFRPDNQNDETKKQILKGIQLALANADSEGMIMGLQIGGQLVQQMKGFEEQGVDINRDVVLANFRQVFSADTLDMDALRAASERVNVLLRRAEDLKAEKEAAAAAEAPEAKKNVDEGKAYIDNLKASDSDIKTSQSGLSYKIINPGEGDPITDRTAVVVEYEGSLTDGTVFDKSPEGRPATFSPAGVIPGFSEGLKMLAKGGEAVFYIPGDLAYGVQGVPQAGIGPNATLIFKVKIVDTRNPE